jgi:hypothetical protein
MERELKVGQHLVFIDADREERDALLLCIHGNPKGEPYRLANEEAERMHWPCVNLVVVSKEPGAQDQYGRQTMKDGHTSIVHWSDNTAQGFCWRWPDEEMESKVKSSVS